MIILRAPDRAASHKNVGRHLLAALLLVGLPGCDRAPEPAQHHGEPRTSDGVGRFLKEYWARPLRAQGTPPARFSPIEASLDPRSCGTCHVAQLNDWRGSLHARAMGPGIAGQLADMKASDRDQHQECLRCHAPLAEQADSLAAALASGQGLADAPLGAPQPLHQHAVTCAACHVRGHKRYGPPRRDGSQAGDAEKLPHGGWTSNAAFGDSRFCAACHQFPPDGYALNGKLIENTHEEWKASRYAREGKSCQSCHMPDRRHLWRGIHDQAMVKGGVTVEVTPARAQSGIVSATLTIRNTGTGHYFPTYVTPRVVAEAYQESARGQMLKSTLRETIIARQVAPDLTEEIADTRIPPDEHALLDYRVSRHRDAASLVFRIRVEPDAFYTGFFRSLLEGSQAGSGQTLIKQALEDSLGSHFTFYTSRQSLPK